MGKARGIDRNPPSVKAKLRMPRRWGNLIPDLALRRIVSLMRLICLFSILLFPGILRAEKAENSLKIELISEVRSIGAGKSFLLGLHLQHPPGSHTYWKNPGIVGLATTVEWDLPPGFTAGEIQWPAPEVVKMASYAAQGYEGETLLMIPITAPAVSSNKTVTLSARVSWMCCGKTCKPAVKVPFDITLPFGDAVDPDPETQPMFAKFREMLPMDDPKWHVTAKRETSQIVLILTPLESATGLKGTDGIHFFTADGQVDSNQKQRVDVFPDGRIQMRLAFAETSPGHAESLPGVVSFPNGNSMVHLTVDPKY